MGYVSGLFFFQPSVLCDRLSSSSSRGGQCTNPPLWSSPSRGFPFSELRPNVFPSPVPHCAPTYVSQECAGPGAFVGVVKQEVDVEAFETSVSPPRVSDEEFDEAVLKEIDAICEQRSSAKRERLTSFGSPPSSQCLTLTRHEKPPDDGNVSGSSKMQQIEEEKENSAQDVVTGDGSVPKAYSEYLESLNDRQREAACSDISVPLMIVAGPGSGKVYFLVSMWTFMNSSYCVLVCAIDACNCLWVLCVVLYSDFNYGWARADASEGGKSFFKHVKIIMLCHFF